MVAKASGKANLTTVLLASWICPGAGHVLLGKRYRAALFFLAVGGLFWLGLALQAYFVFPNTPGESFALFKFLGALASGGHFFIAYILQLGMGNLDTFKEALTNEIGNTCLYTAGILNVLILVDAWDVHTGRKK
jgi:hypothetical protein